MATKSQQIKNCMPNRMLRRRFFPFTLAYPRKVVCKVARCTWNAMERATKAVITNSPPMYCIKCTKSTSFGISIAKRKSLMFSKGEANSIMHPEIRVANRMTTAICTNCIPKRPEMEFPKILRIPNSRPRFKKLPVWKWKKLSEATSRISNPTKEVTNDIILPSCIKSWSLTNGLA